MSDNTNISLFGMTLPLPHWTLPVFGVIAVCGVPVFVYQQLTPSTSDLLTLEQAKRQLQSEVTEYGLHMTDTPTSTYADPGGVFTIKTFDDKCVLIQRRVGGRVLTKLVPDLDRLSNLQAHAHTHAPAPPRPLVGTPPRCRAGRLAAQCAACGCLLSSGHEVFSTP